MKINYLEIRWEPASFALEGSSGDWMKVRGNLFKRGQIVDTIPEFSFTIEAGPLATRPSSWVIWKAKPPVDVDTVILELYDNEPVHTLVADGKSFLVKGTGHPGEVWTEYKFQLEPIRKLEDWLPSPPSVGPPLPKWMGITWPWSV